MSPVRFVSFTPDDGELPPWTHWNQDVLGDWRANFYTPSPPYVRHPTTVTGCGPNATQRLKEMRARVDDDMAEKGYVTFDKLSEEARKYWAEADASWLVADIVRHVAERDG